MVLVVVSVITVLELVVMVALFVLLTVVPLSVVEVWVVGCFFPLMCRCLTCMVTAVSVCVCHGMCTVAMYHVVIHGYRQTYITVLNQAISPKLRVTRFTSTL